MSDNGRKTGPRCIAIVGPNGSGKTSLLRAIAGLLPIAGGVLLWDDEPLAQEWQENGGRIAYVGHQDGIKSGLSVAENLTFWRDQWRGGDIRPGLAAMDLEPHKDRMARSLSAGQRRRLALSRLALGTFELWLLDEPTTALDTQARELLQRLIGAHLAKGGSALIAGHDPMELPAIRSVTIGGAT